MNAIASLLLHVALCLPAGGPFGDDDIARLREMLLDRQNTRNQSQAALVLVQNASSEAEEVVRQGLRQIDATETFLALSSAVRLCQDRRFNEELLSALAAGKALVRQAAADTLAVLADGRVVKKLREVAEDGKAEVALRQSAAAALGRTGRKDAAEALVAVMASDCEPLRQTAGEALTELTGQAHGIDAVRWQAWWEKHKDLSNESWLEMRLGYQTQRARRLEGDLERARGQVLKLQEQLHARLPAADRLAHLQTLAEQEDAAIRALAVRSATELWPVTDKLGKATVADVLLRLSRDPAVDVQRAAVLALGRVPEQRVFDRLLTLLQQGTGSVRAAAARSLAQQARGAGPEAVARQKLVVPALQKALEDPALEVVVEAAEDLGALGVPEAGPVLADLLKHSSEAVRQTAAQALERSADVSVLENLLTALYDPAVTVRFSLVGAIGHAAGGGKSLSEEQRTKLLTRLQELLKRDTDAGVRSRAATVLGQCGSAAVLASLWDRVKAAEDSRVQEKAWAAMVDILVRSGSLDLIREWDEKLARARQDTRRLHLLIEVCGQWEKREGAGQALISAQEMLVQVQLDQGKGTAAFPLVRELLARPGSEADKERRLRWLLTVGEQALRDGDRTEAMQAVRAARGHLPPHKELMEEFAKLEKRAKAEE